MLMGRPGAGVFGVFVAMAGTALTCPRMAAAYSCLAPRLVTPLLGTALPSNGLIWDVCYRTHAGDPLPLRHCPPPTLEDSTGHVIELVVDQQVQSTRYERVLTAYRPSEPLVVGERYRFESDEEWNAFSHEVDVVEADVELPPLPALKAVDFWVRSVLDDQGLPFHARFTFEPFEGNLVVDPEGLLESPFEGLEFSLRDNASVASGHSRREEADSDRIFFLAKEACYINFNAADWGAPASVRFGVLDFAGNFSGWSEPVSIEFPSETTEYPEAERERLHAPPATSACSMTSRGSSPQTSGFVFLLAAAGLLRLARSRLERA
jgi:hypothetical protein